MYQNILKQTKNKVFFLTRAYNDLDCRMPLALEFCKNKKYESVNIIGIPTNKGIYLYFLIIYFAYINC